jgi:hypothetical protein
MRLMPVFESLTRPTPVATESRVLRGGKDLKPLFDKVAARWKFRANTPQGI